MRRAVVVAMAIGLLGASCAVSHVDPKVSLNSPAQLATTVRTRAPGAPAKTTRYRLVWFVVIAVVLLGGVVITAAMLVARDRKRGVF